MNTESSGKYEQLDQIAEEFAARFRRGERPALREYTERYPELAEEIHELFPAMVEMERAETVAPSAIVPLRQVGDYRILREIGRGGMGVVYEAEQASLGRRVALKVLPHHVGGDTRALERFKREARAAARLHHTNIVPVFEVGTDGELCFYAMQFIQGQGLDQVISELRRLRSGSHGQKRSSTSADTLTHDDPARSLACSMLKGQLCAGDPAAANVTGETPAKNLRGFEVVGSLPQPRELGAPSSAVLPGQTDLSAVEKDHRHFFESIARIGQQTAAALAYAHERGIIHRDIKPSNLLLDACGIVWVTDFGLAKTDEGNLTDTGDLIGTFRYMPPERFQGRSDARADVYALGITLYELAVLRPAFQSSDRMTLISQITSDEPDRPRSLDQRIPRDLETIVLKAIAKDPKGRYQTAADMAEDLRRFLGGEPIKARRTSVFERTRMWCRRHKALAGLYLVLFLATAGSSLFAVYLHHLLGKSEDQRKQIALAEADRTEKLYQSLVAQANASRFSHRVGQRFETLEAVRKAAQLVRERQMPEERLNDLRTLAIAALALPDFRTLRTWPALEDDWQPWNADDQLRLYARLGQKEVISLRRIDTDEEIACLDGWRGEFELDFSPGGRFLVARGQHRVRAWDLSGAQPRLAHEGEAYGMAFHPDGQHLLVGRSDGWLWNLDLESGQQNPLFQLARQTPASFLAFDPSAKRLAAITDGKVQILDVKTGSVLSSGLKERAAGSLAWHPNGNYVALVCPEHDIHIWDLKRMCLVADLKGCRNGGIQVSFSPDGDRLLSSGWELMLRLWDWRTGRQVLQRPGASTLRICADGRLLIQEGDRRRHVSVVELASGREYRSIVAQSKAGEDPDYWRPQFHPDGRMMAVPMSDRTRLFDLETANELASLPASGYCLAFQENGALVTNGADGLLRYPIRKKADPDQWQIGPPEILHVGTFLDMACDKKGEVIGQATPDGAFLVRPGKKVTHLAPHFSGRHIAISPDGKYVLTGNHAGEDGVKIWDSETKQLLARFPLGGACGGSFSPNGQWLFIHGSRGQHVVSVGTWKISPREDLWTNVFENGFDFSPDGSLVATQSYRGVIKLLDFATGRELARLEDPDEEYGALAFTPDGSRLVTSGGLSIHGIRVWDLRAIRQQLAEIDPDLDWDAPPYAEAEHVAPLPIHVAVELGKDLDPRTTAGLSSLRLAFNAWDSEAYFDRGRACGRLKDPKKAVDDYTMALTLIAADHESRGEVLLRRSSNYRALGDQLRADADVQQLADLDLAVPVRLQFVAAEECNKLAWRYVTGPAKERDPKKALRLVQKALKLTTDEWAILNTLGVVHYRLGQYPQAVATLERSLGESQGETGAFDLFFLAMCHHQQGDTAMAKDCYDRAVRWFEERHDKLSARYVEELNAFQAEAKTVLAQAKERNAP